VSGFSVDPATGVLTPLEDRRSRLERRRSISRSIIWQVRLRGKRISNNVSVYSVNATNGALAEVTGSPFATAWSPLG